MTTERPIIPKFAAKPVEPAEPDPGPGWLRSRFLGLSWPRPGHEAPCGRASCPVCAPQASEKPECTPIKPDQPGQALEATTVSECAESRTGDTTDDDTIQTEEAIKHLRRHFHIYEGRDYITLRCAICQQMFGIKPNVPILERSSFDMLMDHARAHDETPACELDYSRQHPPTKGAVRSLEAQGESYDASDDFSRAKAVTMPRWVT